MRAESSPSSIGRRKRFLAALIVVTLTPFAARPQGISSAASPPPSPPLSAFAAHKAETLLRERLPCLGCHVLRGEGGRIGPDLTKVRERRTPAYIAAMVANPQATAPGSAMPKTVMTPATQALVIRYLASLPGNATSDANTPAASVAASGGDGAALYARWCAACHGSSGKGDGPNAANLPVKPAAHTDAIAMSKRPDDSLYDTIAGGGAIMNRSARMPAFGATLTATEIRALVAHIRSLCSCQGPDWSRDEASPARGH